MLNIKNSKCSVYKIEDKGKYVKGSIRTSKLNKQTDEWESNFFNVKFVGSCFVEAKVLEDKDRIEIKSGILQYNESEDKKKWYEVVIFEFETLSKPVYFNTKVEDDGLPF